jgi:hypothetical protein
MTMTQRRKKEEWEDMIDEAVAFTVLANNQLFHQMLVISGATDEDDDTASIDHRQLPRAQCHQFKHGEALACINRDYLGPDALFGKDFDMMFRLSRKHFQKLLEDVGNSGDQFYLAKKDAFNREVSSIEARLLLPLKTLAYGVPPHCFCDYFQMSKNYARSCCLKLDHTLKKLYAEEYLRLLNQGGSEEYFQST